MTLAEALRYPRPLDSIACEGHGCGSRLVFSVDAAISHHCRRDLIPAIVARLGWVEWGRKLMCRTCWDRARRAICLGIANGQRQLLDTLKHMSKVEFDFRRQAKRFW
jgi:hypothetical protein